MTQVTLNADRSKVLVAMNANQISFADAKTRTRAFVDHYKAIMSTENNVTALIQSEPGVGKTTFLTTCRKPVLVDQFDPKGTTVIRDLIEKYKGDFVVRPWWDMTNAYQRWKEQFEKDLATGYLSYFGTYSMDTITGFSDAVSYDYTETQGRADNVPLSSIKGEAVGGDYNYIKARIANTIKLALAQRCDVVMTAHLLKYQDSKNVTHIDIMAIGQLRTIIPSLFTEKWILYVDPTTRARWLLVDRYGLYKASTQIGIRYNVEGERENVLGVKDANGNRTAFEVPNMKHILKKCGLSDEDNPSLVE